MEAETTIFATCLHSELLLAQIFQQNLIRKLVNVIMIEDNEATIISIRKKYYLAMRYLSRVYRISIGLLNEIITREETDDDGNVRVHKAATADYKRDLFTKKLERAKFEHALNII